jgi:hypothetical protein
MKLRILVTLLGVSALLLLTAAVLAQEPDPWERETLQIPYPPTHEPQLDELGPWAWRAGAKPQLLTEGPVEPAAVTLGEPGLSFRYVDTFGVAEQAYIPDAQHLYRPNGLCIDNSDNLYVVEENGARMLKYRTSDGANLLSRGTAGLHEVGEYVFSWPKAVAVDSGGNVWVADNHRVTQYDASGNFLQVFPDWDDNPWWSGDDNGHFDSPRGIAFDSGGRMYVSDRWNHRVQVYTLGSGSPIYSATIGVTGISGDDNSHFNEPAHSVIDGSDRLYVADAMNHRVQRCTYASNWTCATFHGTGIQGSGADQLSWASGLGIDGSDNIYIADNGNGRVKKCDTGGSCSTFASGFAWPADVAVDSGGNVYVSDFNDDVIYRYTSSGTSSGVFAGTSGVPYLTDNNHFNTPYGVAVDPSSNIYVTTYRGFRLLKLSASGVPQWAAGTPGVWGNDNVHFGSWWAGPHHVAVDASGKVFVADTGNHRIQIYNSGGTYLATLGDYGSGNYEFDVPRGVALDSSDNIYVADSENHRVQIYNSSRVYVGRIGVTGVPGDDNAHFDRPYGVAVNSNGDVYVADNENRRVQKCTGSGSTWTCSTFAGVTDEWGDDFGHFSRPRDVAVDAQNRVYVADVWNNRVQVFDNSGAYLTTIGGEWGGDVGRFRNPHGVHIDADGNVYIADSDSHRIQKFAPGVPGWTQVNINGFGDRWNEAILSLAHFNGTLYAGTYNWDVGAQVWRMGSAWERVNDNGFGDGDNLGVNHLIGFNGQLYAATLADEVDGGEVWRSTDGTSWDQVVSNGFGDPTNAEILRFAVFGDHLYASTWSYTDTRGTEIYSTTNGTAWTQAVSNGFDGDANNEGALSFEVFGGSLYAGTYNSTTGGEVWRSSDGSNWTQVNSDGFEDAGNTAVSALAAFEGYLYASTSHDSGAGAEVWRCQTCDGSDWTQVVNNAFGNSETRIMPALEVLDGRLLLVVGNFDTGLEAWRTADGAVWQQVGFAGFGDANNLAPYWDNPVVVFDEWFYVGTWNYANGGEVWKMWRPSFVPLAMKSF